MTTSTAKVGTTPKAATTAKTATARARTTRPTTRARTTKPTTARAAKPAKPVAKAPIPRLRLTDDEFQAMMGTVGKSDSVELKLTVADAERRNTIRALQMDPLNAQIRQVVFFDTPDLALSKAGVVVRARRSIAKGDDSTIKLRPVEPDDLSKSLRSTPGFVVEVDAMPGSWVCSGALSAGLPNGDVWDALQGRRPIRKLFSKAQRAFYEEHAPAGIALDDLSMLGPIFVLKLKWTPRRFARPMVAEAWLYPDGSQILELSTKAPPSQAFQVAAEARAFLGSLGITASSGQETKTRRALRTFSQRLQAEQSADAAG